MKTRTTRQKNIVFQVLKSTKAHPSAQMLFRMARRRLPSLSFATVYRNLKVLEKENKVCEVACGKLGSRYDGDTREHAHFCCLKCERIFDIDALLPKGLDRRVSARAGFLVLFHRMNVYGYCRVCRKRK